MLWRLSWANFVADLASIPVYDSEGKEKEPLKEVHIAEMFK